jgi:hypothetical protein
MAKRETKDEYKYIVAPGHSFVGQKRAFVSGDEITKAAFVSPKDFERFISAKRILKVPVEEAATPAADKTGDERKQLEESFLAQGLGKPEDMSALSDDELKQLIGGSGN